MPVDNIVGRNPSHSRRDHASRFLRELDDLLDRIAKRRETSPFIDHPHWDRYLNSLYREADGKISLALAWGYLEW